MSAGEWCLIESDPGVFTELIRGFGVQGLQVEEMWSLDGDQFKKLKPIHGLIFLYKWRPGEEPQGSVVKDRRLDDIFFAKQMITNACATQAILSVLLNVSHPDIELGTVLSEFREFAISFDPASRGLALTNSEQIRKVHNSFARQQMFEFDKQQPSKDDAFHFVAYVPFQGRLYELDGLREGPIDLGKFEQDDWIGTAKEMLDKRILSYTSDEIHFNLMAIVSDRRKLSEREITELERKKQLAAQRIESLVSGQELMDDGSGLPSDPEQLQAVIEEVEAKVISLQGSIAEEEAKMEGYRIENIRRRHNYLPLIMEVLKILATRGELVRLCQEAKQKKAQQREASKKTESAKPQEETTKT